MKNGSDRMVCRIGAVIMAVDGFTGEMITDGDLLVRCGNGRAPVRKPGGYYVFWDDGCTELTVILESPWFEKVTVTVSVWELQKKREPVYFVYLIPSLVYPFPQKAVETVREALPGAIVSAALLNTGDMLRVEEFLPWKGEEFPVLRVKNRYGLLLEDRFLYLLGDDGMGELCRLGMSWGKERDMLCLLSPLKGEYTKERCKLFLVYRAKADQEGNIKIPGAYRLCEQEETTWGFAYARERF